MHFRRDGRKWNPLQRLSVSVWRNVRVGEDENVPITLKQKESSPSPWIRLHRCRTQSGELTHSHPEGQRMTPLFCPCLGLGLEPGGLSTHASTLVSWSEETNNSTGLQPSIWMVKASKLEPADCRMGSHSCWLTEQQRPELLVLNAQSGARVKSRMTETRDTVKEKKKKTHTVTPVV